MAIDTEDKKLALMEGDQFEPAIPLNEDMSSEDTKRQLLWGYPGFGVFSTKFSFSGSNPIFRPACRILSHVGEVREVIYTPPEAAPAIEDVMAITSDYTITGTGEYVIVADATSGPIVLSLPPVASSDAMELYFKKSDASSNNVTIEPNGDEKIDRRPRETLGIQDETIGIIGDADGGYWQVLTDYPGP